MRLNRVIAVVLTLVVTLGTITPVFAQGPGFPEQAVSQVLVIPNGEPLSDEELSEVQGEWAPIAVGALVSGASYAITNWDKEKDTDWYVKGAIAATSGALTAGIGGALATTVTTQVGKAAVDIFTWGTQATIGWILGHDTD